MTLSERIQHELEQSIRHPSDLPDYWTLEMLAQQFQVSLTPVRTAVRTLLEQGWLLRDEQSRLIANPERIGKRGESRPAPLPVSPDWERTLREMILRSSLDGEARFLREEAIAEQFGISRTIVRQHFSKFAGSGFLEHVPRRGWRLTPFREADMLAYLDVREVLECHALQLAWPKLDPAEIQRMHDANLPAPHSQEPRLDNQLHAYFLAHADNRYLSAFFQTHGGYFSALFDYAALGADALADMATQHRQILAAILAQNLPAAQSALRSHIQAQAPTLRRLVSLARSLPSESSVG
ncbi:GntR family transcriptional regulator [Tuwongella immobilis]|uniref:HTH gntR-type domain-containing protein n=1 Tax=Tuwongella immobilis TaxID=692036 RepID=A0A6C2YGG0_9BACT|nr:GntR family transcriptional regulator [Tuwongella immobilis]VIP00578.1 family transcriptional regulator : GntR domain protein OS=Planctomyces limnophilus (strain ATCC 43296 / DSM 3776 / IFAM 1008 / 290) GN=Plim_1958 PE=4 SV=1: GntR: GntR: FCD [Tuwongella immobilis]VTR96574.1 family transcriptional regulator : GntR domain protein OS=Planctomyces limnophilus (strain ATCC 43296 / DSM 3776 / IFAM 1008 / 290) GN=Plim_1958 PE=4 SV=1: GntR: GntR: FCD [Tuwongella immobilis]